MAGSSLKKRSFSDGPKGKAQRPTKKQRQVAAYHSSSEEEESDNDEGGPIPSNLLDSDEEDLDNLEADDGASTEASDSDSQSDSDSAPNPKSKSQQNKPDSKQKKFVAKDAPASDNSSDDEDGDDGSSDEDDDAHSGSDDGLGTGANRMKSKRNDPEAFATSISKMLSSKLPTSKRADPIVARSAAAADNAKQLVDTALEAKARKRLREQKRLAMEKGRVRDVLVPSTKRTLNLQTGEIEEVLEDGAETTGQLLATERRLRKVAQRGVVKLFNAVRAAQVKASEAERAVKREGIVGVKRKEEKITEMSRKGFLDLIANGGGGLKKGGLEEA
ncbi:Rrp15p-domain-containing protein [Triangularia verruculosa]|uniref:Rrp15p-domain-containing protein n=1 Tax=Triangularia verruculosa TaxID=2587418 RepID=A0AAN6XBL1_9PEZI|nr:Rrp15p-domain-containing protein [Triangularia verruculosa]